MILPGSHSPLMGGGIPPLLTPQFIAATSYDGVSGSNNCILNVPTHAEGDLLIAAVGHTSADRAITVPTGWTLLFSDTSGIPTTSLLTRVASGSEPSSYTFGHLGLTTSQRAVGFMLCYRDADTVDAYGTVDKSTASSVIRTAPALAVPDGYGLCAALISPSANTGMTSYPAGMTTRAVGNRSEFSDLLPAVSSDAGDKAWSRSFATSANMSAFQFTIKGLPDA